MKELIKVEVQTMTLKEITDLLETRHNDAMKIVSKMSASLEFGELRKIRTSYTNNIGAVIELETYQLDKRQSVAVSARLNTNLLMRVIDRWQELEAAQPKLPANYIAALQALIESEKEKETALSQLENVTSKAAALEERLDESEEWLSIKRVAHVNNISWKTISWFDLKRHGFMTGKLPKKVFDANYGEVNSYHVDSWMECYPELMIRFENE